MSAVMGDIETSVAAKLKRRVFNRFSVGFEIILIRNNLLTVF